jgi:hypothetical protein
MNRHALHYLDLHPAPVNTDEPHPLTIWAGAALCMLAFWLVCVFLFSL